MKNLIFVNGTMGAGKSATCEVLKERLDHCVFLDGDDCWNMHPFIVTDETKQMVQDNIAFLLNQFLRCSQYENIIFCWVMHQQSIIDAIVAKVNEPYDHLFIFTLMLTPAALTSRLEKDIQEHKRQKDVIERSIERLKLYNALDTIKIDTNKKTAIEVALEMKDYIDNTVLIKPHHFLDIIKLYGGGLDVFVPDQLYHHDFARIGNLVIQNPQLRILLTTDDDDICSPCLHLKNHSCDDSVRHLINYNSKEHYNKDIDHRMIGIMNLSTNHIYDVKELLEIMYQYRRDIPYIWKEENEEQQQLRLKNFTNGVKKYLNRE